MEESTRYEVVKNYGHDGATETDSLARAEAIARGYAERTGQPTYIADWSNDGEIVAEYI